MYTCTQGWGIINFYYLRTETVKIQKRLTQHAILRYHKEEKKAKEKSRVCHNHKTQPFPDTKRKKKQTKPNKR